jgi:predicted nucleic acid-binding protein
MSAPKIVVHTDMLLGHVRGDRTPSLLRKAMNLFFCYTTVFQAVEMFALAESHAEQRAMEDTMAAMKIMGLNPKQAARYGNLLARSRRADTLAILIAGLCLESRLPLMTDRAVEFRGIAGLTIVPARLLTRYNTADEIFRAV